jgi:putative transposase
VIRSHRIALDPTFKQRAVFSKAAGAARYAWNWALNEAEQHYKLTGKAVNFLQLKKRWNAEKPEWTYESGKDATQQPFTNLSGAYSRFFKKQAKRPKLKKKHKSRDSFYVSNDKFKVVGKQVRLPKAGGVRLREELRFPGKILSATVSRTADRWYISIQVDTPAKEQPVGTEVIGIDVGLKVFATLSSGETIQAPLPLKANLLKLKRLSKRHSRKMKGSKNKAKSAMKLARLHSRIANIRSDFLHKLTSKLAAKAKLIVLEDLTVQGMLQLWGRKTADSGLFEFKRQLLYKCAASGAALAQADRWYPSSQICSRCGNRQKLPLTERTYTCPLCGMVKCRDQNAADNLHTLGWRGINACGQEGSDEKLTLLVKPAWLKQELNRGISTNFHI